MQKTQVQSLGWEDPLEKGMTTTVFLPREFHGQRSLAGYSPWGRKESDIRETNTFTFSHSYNHYKHSCFCRYKYENNIQ